MCPLPAHDPVPTVSASWGWPLVTGTGEEGRGTPWGDLLLYPRCHPALNHHCRDPMSAPSSSSSSSSSFSWKGFTGHLTLTMGSTWSCSRCRFMWAFRLLILSNTLRRHQRTWGLEHRRRLWGGGTLRGWSRAKGGQCRRLQGAQYLSHSRQGKAPWPSTFPGASGLRLGPALGLELRMDSLL